MYMLYSAGDAMCTTERLVCYMQVKRTPCVVHRETTRHEESFQELLPRLLHSVHLMQSPLYMRQLCFLIQVAATSKVLVRWAQQLLVTRNRLLFYFWQLVVAWANTLEVAIYNFCVCYYKQHVYGPANTGRS